MGKGEESDGKEEEGQGWGLKGHGRYRGGMGLWQAEQVRLC